jgi:hypothetical protein
MDRASNEEARRRGEAWGRDLAEAVGDLEQEDVLDSIGFLPRKAIEHQTRQNGAAFAGEFEQAARQEIGKRFPEFAQIWH